MSQVTVEVLAAGGWSRAGLGDTFSSEDSFALLVLDGGVARTSAVKDSKAPVWAASDRRAFRFAIADPSATLFVALFDEDPDPLSTDDPIGRCALAPRSLAPGATYDAWFPLSLKANEGAAPSGGSWRRGGDAADGDAAAGDVAAGHVVVPPQASPSRPRRARWSPKKPSRPRPRRTTSKRRRAAPLGSASA